MERNLNSTGSFEVRYLAFLETVTQIRPRLHRYCSRMAGSVLDGEDLVQDALFEAYRKLGQFDDSRPLAPWLFRIAHNRCIDFLRRRSARDVAEANAAVPDSVPAAVPASLGIRPAIERLVLMLPPKERACVLLKEVFDYSLEEIAELVGSTVGGGEGSPQPRSDETGNSPRSPQGLSKQESRRDPGIATLRRALQSPRLGRPA
jgi:RNA polymerase sigma-70 factor (ECF subfamily)